MSVKIGVEADLGSLNSSLDAATEKAEGLQKALSGGRLAVDTGEYESRMKAAQSAAANLRKVIEEKKTLGVDTADAEKQLAKVKTSIADSVRELSGGSQGKSRQEVAMERLASKTKLATNEIKKQQDALRALGRSYSETQVDAISRAHSSMRSSGGANAAYVQHASFADLLSDRSGNAAEKSARARASQRILQNAGVAQQGGPAHGRFGGPKSYMLAGAAGGALGSLATGGVGAGLGSGLGSMLGGGLGFLLGGPLGATFGASLGSGIGGSIGTHVSGAETESTGLADLRRSLGGITVDFEMLRSTTRAASAGLGLTYAESLKLAKEFTSISGGRGGRGLSGDVHNAAGFSRSLGLDPSQGTSFFATMRLFKADGGDSKRMSATIAEAISRGNFGSKSDELLSTISNFASITARQSLVAAPNVAGFAGMLSSMGSMNKPGLDIQAAAAIMSKSDAAFRGTGDEATNTFKLGAYQSAFGGGFSSLDMELIQSQGLFGSAHNAMQQVLDDPKASPSRKARAKKMLGSGNADRANIDILMNKLSSVSREGSDFYEKSGSTAFGVSQQEFRVLQQAWKGYGSAGMSGRLKKDYGIDVSKVATSRHMNLATILGSNSSMLGSQAGRFMKGDFGSLTKEERASLQGKMSKVGEKDGVENLRRELLNLAKDKELVDIGTATRDNIKQVENVLTEMSTSLTGATNAVRDAVLWVAGKSPAEFDKIQRNMAVSRIDDTYRSEVNSALGADFGDLVKVGSKRKWNETPASVDIARFAKMSPEQKKKVQEARAKHQAAMDLLNGKGKGGGDAVVDAVDEHGMSGTHEVVSSAGPLANPYSSRLPRGATSPNSVVGTLHAVIDVNSNGKTTTVRQNVTLSNKGGMATPAGTGR